MAYALLMLLIFCFFIHNMCAERGISPWGYLAGFIAGYFLIVIGTGIAVLVTYGMNVMNQPGIEKKLVNYGYVQLALNLLLFASFWYKISRVKIYRDNEEDDDNHLPPPPSGKKDLSYFR